MSRTTALCGLRLAAEGEICHAIPAYRIEACSANGKRCVILLCSEHVHRSWHLAQNVLERRYPSEGIKVRSIHLHQIVRATKAEAASAKIG